MIFNNLNTLPLTYGAYKKEPCKHKKRRSNMMINPLNLIHLNRIDNLEADMLTLNLEDAIAPTKKKQALHNIALFLSYLKKSDSFIVIRVNPLDEGGLEEIHFLHDFYFDAIRVSKIKNQKEIDTILKILPKEKELHISLETKEAFHQLASFKQHPQFTTASLGILDLLNSLGLPQSLLSYNHPTIDYILSKFLIDAKIANLHPISFMFQAYHNIEAFKKWCEYEKNMGFESKACMGPKQVSIVNEIFNHSLVEIERANYIKKIFEQNMQHHHHGFMDKKYGFIDEPIYKDALLILNQSKG